MLDVEGFILVGGASSRMGTDKSHLVLGGQTTVERIAAAMSSITLRVQLVGARAKQTPYPNVADLAESWGPLGGIQAALHAATADWSIVVACDLPFITPELLQRLLGFLSKDSETFDAVVPIQADNYPQPLCAVYRRVPCISAADQAIANDEHSPRALLDKVRARFVPFGEFSDLPGSANFFFNVNTPENYNLAKRLCQNRER